ncbi:MAG: CRISPR-associated endonuclease Cas2 [Chthoniobacterales bacterium]|nr:CRISPR-associated endonuclease Cas2 [Chthoniobacterales bacterium]
MNSSFRMGWILVSFDLPVMTDQQRKAATGFRNALLEDGYMMLQFSVYARACVSLERLERHAFYLRSIAPTAGNIRVFFFTNQQWARSMSIHGQNYPQGNRVLDPTMPQQIEFW